MLFLFPAALFPFLTMPSVRVVQHKDLVLASKIKGVFSPGVKLRKTVAVLKAEQMDDGTR